MGARAQALQVVPGIAAFFFDDDKTLGPEADALLESSGAMRQPLINGHADSGTPSSSWVPSPLISCSPVCEV